MRECGSTKCGKLATREKRPVVWTVDRKYYCNVCFLNDLEDGKISIDQIIHRLYDDENLYHDIRTQKRRRRVHEPSKYPPPVAILM